MSKTVVYNILKELGGKDVPIQDIIARIREKYPGDKYMAERAGLKLYRLYRDRVLSRTLQKGFHGGFSYTIEMDYE